MTPELITREQAYVRGLKRFYTGVACGKNHDSERYTSNGGCIACMTFSTPGRRRGPKGTNVAWPSRGLVCKVPGVEPHELVAAFLFIEDNGWLDAAVLKMREDPALLKRYTPLLSVQEQAKLTIALENDRAARRAIASETEK